MRMDKNAHARHAVAVCTTGSRVGELEGVLEGKDMGKGYEAFPPPGYRHQGSRRDAAGGSLSRALYMWSVA